MLASWKSKMAESFQDGHQCHVDLGAWVAHSSQALSVAAQRDVMSESASNEFESKIMILGYVILTWVISGFPHA